MKPFITNLVCIVLFIHGAFSQSKNEDPVAVDDVLYFGHPGTFSIDLLANDYDPEGDSIFVYDIDFDEDELDISIEGSIVTVNITIHDFGQFFDEIKYKIQDENGNKERAYLYVSFKQDIEAAQAVEDSIIALDQVIEEMNLIENDFYDGDENLKLFKVTSPYCNISILPDSQSIAFSSDAYHGPIWFSYWMIENGGNQYVSKGGGFAFTDKNENAPIARADTFDVQAGETFYLDVLANDIGAENLEIDSIYTANTYFSIENHTIKFDVPDTYRGAFYINYRIIDSNTQLKSMPVKVRINIETSPNIPIANRDTVEFVFTGEEVELFPLVNDESPVGNPLIVYESGSESIMFTNINSTGWFKKEYRCRDTLLNINSQTQTIHIHVLPPDSIEIENLYVDYIIGEEMIIDPYESTNIPDSIWAGVSSQLGDYNYDSKSYSFDILNFEDLLSNEWKDIYDLNDTIVISFNFREGYNNFYVKKYIYVNYIPTQFYSELTINNVDLMISPNGFHYDDIIYPSESELEPISQLNIWVCDFTDQLWKRVSGNSNLIYGADFVYGPLVDDYSDSYGQKYYRTWKISKSEILSHIYNWDQAGYEMPENIENWPSQKTVYQGKEYEGADFIDFNNNDIYDPENGDYPKITGDEAVMYIVNDGRFGNMGEGWPLDSLNIDIYAMIYAFNRPESEYFNNTFFAKYKVINKSDIDYEDFKFGMFSQAGFGNMDYSYSGNQMYIGCDTEKNTFYSFPGVNSRPDRTLWPVKPPISLFTLLNSSLDKFTQVAISTGGFGSWDNFSAQKRYHYMNGTWDSTLLPPYPYWHGNSPIDFVFPDDPLDFGANNQISYPHYIFSYYGDANMVGTTGSHTLLSGESKTFEYAIQFYLDSESGYAESLENALSNVSDLIQCYENDSVPGGGSFTGVETVLNNFNTQLLIYPNPAKTVLYVDGLNESNNYSIYTLQGQKIEEGRLENEISIDHLSKGFYLLQIRSLDGKQEWTSKFVKQ